MSLFTSEHRMRCFFSLQKGIQRRIVFSQEAHNKYIVHYTVIKLVNQLYRSLRTRKTVKLLSRICCDPIEISLRTELHWKMIRS